MKTMIPFEEGLELVLNSCPVAGSEWIPLPGAYGRVLAATVNAPSASPPFDQSAMDGYAFRFEDLRKYARLRMTDLVRAGDQRKVRLPAGACVRLFTGAPVPAGADTVVMQEKVQVENGWLHIMDEQLTKGANIRARASHVGFRDSIAAAGDRLTAPRMALLASLGVHKVKVLQLPSVGIIVTGDELAVPGKRLGRGEVYECNATALTAAVISVLPGTTVKKYRVKDRLSATSAVIAKALLHHDVVLITGGVSVGDYDFVLPALKENKVKMHFHKLLQKPGKPVCFGTKSRKMLFGLPGNPASVLTCFYTLVIPALARRYGASALPHTRLPILNSYRKKQGLTHFLKAEVTENGVRILSDQESYKLTSFAQANALVKIDAHLDHIASGTLVDTLLING